MLDENQPFGRWLKQRRRELDLTQEALAERVSCSVDMIGKLEAGRARPSRHLAEILATCLQIAPDEHAAFVRSARAGVPPASEPLPRVSASPPSPSLGPAPTLRNLPPALAER